MQQQSVLPRTSPHPPAVHWVQPAASGAWFTHRPAAQTCQSQPGTTGSTDPWPRPAVKEVRWQANGSDGVVKQRTIQTVGQANWVVHRGRWPQGTAAPPCGHQAIRSKVVSDASACVTTTHLGVKLVVALHRAAGRGQRAGCRAEGGSGDACVSGC